MRYFSFLLFLFILFPVVTTPAYALREPKPQTIDGRLKTLMYNKNEVFKFTGYFYYQSIIELAEDEAITNIAVGLPHLWQVQSIGHRIFIKPISDTPEEATTHMTVITNKHIYFFELYAAEAEDVTEQRIPFIIRFIYPETERIGEVSRVSQTLSDVNKESRNYNYTISGSENIAPAKVYDNQIFTFFEFRDNAPIPAFFEVNSDGYESVINYRVEEDIIVVEKVISQFTLRYGDDIICVFNETNPLRLKKKD